MSSDGNNRREGEVRHADPERAATDSRAAARQDEVKANHDALEEQARRVESSVSSGVRNTPIEAPDNVSDRNDTTPPRRIDEARLATDPRAAEIQDRVHADHDALQDSARRVASSVPENVRDTPVQPLSGSDRGDAATSPELREARENANAARESAKRVEDSVRDTDRRGGR